MEEGWVAQEGPQGFAQCVFHCASGPECIHHGQQPPMLTPEDLCCWHCGFYLHPDCGCGIEDPDVHPHMNICVLCHATKCSAEDQHRHRGNNPDGLPTIRKRDLKGRMSCQTVTLIQSTKEAAVSPGKKKRVERANKRLECTLTDAGQLGKSGGRATYKMPSRPGDFREPRTRSQRATGRKSTTSQCIRDGQATARGQGRGGGGEEETIAATIRVSRQM